MKILFYNHTGQASGAERLLLMILAKLDRDDFDTIMVCPEQGPLAKMVRDQGIPVETVGTLEARFTWRVDDLARYCNSFFRVIRQVRKSVISTKPDLIHANSIRAGLVATTATFRLGTRVIWHLHDMLPRHPLSTLIRIFASISSRTCMIAVSEAVARNFRGRFSGLMMNRVNVILNAIDLKKFEPGQTTREEIRRELQLAVDEPLIGIVGQLTPRKGQLELMRAFAQVLTEIPEALLLLVGAPLFNRDHEYRELLGRTASKLGIQDRVRMVGARSDVAAIMQSLDLLVINSSVEPFGLVAVESMACGTPVLAAAVDGIPEIVEHDKNGWMVPPRDERMLKEAIVRLIRRPILRARLAARGKQHVAAYFSAGRYISELETFYDANGDLKSRTVVAESTSRQSEAAKFA